MRELYCGRFVLPLNRPLVMGIINLTPDSFSDGGRFNTRDAALRQAEQFLHDGVDILDIGGESTRPNATPVSVQEEIDRVLPVLESLNALNCPISLDTRRTEVMRVALPLGVDLINDVSALEDEGALELVQDSAVGVCLMHKQGNPDTMQLSPYYEDVVHEVGNYLARRVTLCLEAGIDARRLLVDPGFGFGKTLEYNLDLLTHLRAISHRAGVPVLAGLSRKSMLGQLAGEPEPQRRLGASIAAAMLAVQSGASVVRVHDVRETCQALQVQHAVLRYQTKGF